MLFSVFNAQIFYLPEVPIPSKQCSCGTKVRSKYEFLLVGLPASALWRAGNYGTVSLTPTWTNVA